MEHQWTRCYRMRPSIRNVGCICTVFFAVVGLSSTLAAYFNVDGSFARPQLAALIFGIFWSAFTFLGIWLLLLYYKYGLFVNESSLRQVGVVRDKQIDLNLVDEMKWRRFPAGGSVRLAGGFGVLKIELGNLNIVNREELITFLRKSISESRQSGWEPFVEQLAETPEKRKRSRRGRILLALFVGTHAIAFGVVWAIGGETKYLVMSGVNAMLTAYVIRVHLRDPTESDIRPLR